MLVQMLAVINANRATQAYKSTDLDEEGRCALLSFRCVFFICLILQSSHRRHADRVPGDAGRPMDDGAAGEERAPTANTDLPRGQPTAQAQGHAGL